jgi:hypothetical protein
MPRLTLADVQASRIPPALGLCPTDAKFIAYVNEAQQRLLSKGLWWGVCGKWKLAAYGGEITMPPQLSTIESVAINHVPISVHDFWFEFLTNGFGTRSASEVGTAAGSSLGGATGVYGIPEANFRGNFPTFRNLTPNTDTKKLVLVCDLAVDVGATVTVLGYDNNGNWIRTLQGSVYADGEVIALSQTPGTTSVNNFSNITDIQFAAPRSGQCWLYENDTVTGVKTLTGLYQWFETNPSYGRWLMPSIFQPSSTSGVTPPSNWQQTWTQGGIPNPTLTAYIPSLVEVMGKKAFIPVSLPTDYLILGNLPALKNEAVCVKKLEDAVSSQDVQEAMAFETMAISELDYELDSNLGSSRRVGITVTGSGGATNEPIETFM